MGEKLWPKGFKYHLKSSRYKDELYCIWVFYVYILLPIIKHIKTMILQRHFNISSRFCVLKTLYTNRKHELFLFFIFSFYFNSYNCKIFYFLLFLPKIQLTVKRFLHSFCIYLRNIEISLYVKSTWYLFLLILVK